MKSKKIIGTMALLIAIASAGGTIANAAIINKGATTKTVVLDTTKTKDSMDMKAKEITDREFSNVVGDVEKKQNLPIIKDLMEKAKNYLGNGFYVETKLSCEGGIGGNRVVKQYWQDGNYRSEEFGTDGKLLYVTVYNKAEDINYDYDVKNNALGKCKNYCKIYPIASDRLKYYFLYLDNARFGDFKTIDYNGKKAVYSKAIVKDGDKIKADQQIWYDAETGMILNFQQKCFKPDGKVAVYTNNSYTVKSNQTFDSSVFKYDENNKSVGDLKLK
ncbi:hypothetical protein [Clostridium sp. JS66]|uniref:hypothetical protein n=1 Tax=Clostridium sp. JS66 TaxID=3064705 RepID=UPI00298E262B|nr:hypothetical protein [Clostridium sp. JS66]WPC42538.1 hypothetical protein Q6H37_03470 [Clostridium sp. JS66]